MRSLWIPILSLALLLGILICLYLAWRPSPFLSELGWMPEGFARWADAAAQSHTRTAIPFLGLGVLGGILGAWMGDRRFAWMLFAGLMGLSLLLELGQLLLPGRHATVDDVLWGWLGLCGGWLLVLFAIWGRDRTSN